MFAKNINFLTIRKKYFNINKRKKSNVCLKINKLILF